MLSWSPIDQYIEESDDKNIINNLLNDIMKTYDTDNMDAEITMAWSVAVILFEHP